MPMTSKKTAKPAKAQKLAKANTNTITQKVVIKRKLKYVYPKGMTDTLKRKAYRQKVRNGLRKLERDFGKLKGEEKKAKKIELADFLEKHLV